MREMDIADAAGSMTRLARMKIITSRASSKVRSEDEIRLLMKSARNRFHKAVATGRIEIINDREWRLH